MKKILISAFPLAISTIVFAAAIPVNQSESVESMAPAKTEVVETQDEEPIVYFKPPKNWLLADANALLPSVKVIVIGKGNSALPPSINLSWEPYQFTLKQYLQAVKNRNTAQGYEWKDMGMIQTDAGPGDLSMVDSKSAWGDVRSMHLILLKDKRIYILTASAVKSEFSNFYKEFFDSIKSLKVAKNVYDLVENKQQRAQLQNAVRKLMGQWKEMISTAQSTNPTLQPVAIKEKVFNSAEFQNQILTPFRETLNEKFGQQGQELNTLFLQKIEDQLFTMKF